MLPALEGLDPGRFVWGSARALEWLTPKKYEATQSANPSTHKERGLVVISTSTATWLTLKEIQVVGRACAYLPRTHNPIQIIC
uniref:Uncharacterized protein n=1 Tax=Hyaloperonospora arabidopsidis (strain Emoy2) TaxID=559515 RepID=M4BHV4_HYAAE